MTDPKTAEVKKRKQGSASDTSAKPTNKGDRRKLDTTTHRSVSYSAVFPKLIVTFGEKIAERMETTAFDSLNGLIMDRIVDIQAGGFVLRFKDTILGGMVCELHLL